MNVTLVKGNEWDVLYVDGVKALEHTSINIEDAIIALKLPVSIEHVVVAENATIQCPAPNDIKDIIYVTIENTEEEEVIENYSNNGEGIISVPEDANDVDDVLKRIVFGSSSKTQTLRDEVENLNATEDTGRYDFPFNAPVDKHTLCPSIGQRIYVPAASITSERASAGYGVVEDVIQLDYNKTPQLMSQATDIESFKYSPNLFVKIKGVEILYRWNEIKNMQEYLAENHNEEVRLDMKISEM